ncbi:flagellar biosynthetic protein FliO [Bacillus sp. ISL-18]|uniref:flagellar biosynthetic protein FliO n=1 Tax=Bacillus sp. ISL-18 TaxID=2819118 RepID=UPI001BE58914|nr:flagellar biosynthetic protein FliO [Bacillus sp. ISL-18]MBT2657837.1 flagellar biosynthetic protein FliO [Bacillus sp. ISL-18]
MKRLMSLIILFFYLFSFQPTIFAAGSDTGGTSVYEAIKKGNQHSSTSAATVADSTSPSLFPMFIKFIVSFGLVIVLLVLLLRFLAKKNRLLPANGPVLPLGGHSLGNNRSLQVLLIGQTIYVVGVGEDVTLIRTISQGEEYQRLLEGYETQADGVQPPKWFPQASKTNWNAVFRKHITKFQRENEEE